MYRHWGSGLEESYSPAMVSRFRTTSFNHRPILENSFPPYLLLPPSDFRCQNYLTTNKRAKSSEWNRASASRRGNSPQSGGFKAMTTSAENGRKHGQPAMHTPRVVSSQAWEAARRQLLVKEKAQ